MPPDLTTLRQGHRRRPARRRLRRAGRRHGPRWPRSGPCTRRAPCRGTRSPRPRGSPRSACSTTTPTRRSSHARRGSPRGLDRAFADAGIDVPRRPASHRWWACTSATGPTDYDGARRTDEAAYAALFHAPARRGVAIAPGAYEVMFPGLAHTDDVLDRRSSSWPPTRSKRPAEAGGAARALVAAAGAPSASPEVTWPRHRRARALRCHRRPGPQEDLPGDLPLHAEACSTCRSSGVASSQLDRRRPARHGPQAPSRRAPRPSTTPCGRRFAAS